MLRKLLSVLLSVCILLSVLTVSSLAVSAREADIAGIGVTDSTGNWKYVPLDDGTVQIKTWGAGFKTADVVIPSVLDGKKVTSVSGDWDINSYVESVTLPDSITTLDNRSFYCFENLKSVTFSKNLKSIDWGAFGECSNLEELKLPEGLESIGESAFEKCYKLYSLTIPDSVTSVGEYAFKESGLQSVKLGKGLKEISGDMFWGSSLESIDLSTIEKINGYAFGSCGNLEEVFIPKTVTEIGKCPFHHCSNLRSIVVESGNPVYDSRGNCNAIVKTAENKVIQACPGTNGFPEGAEIIGDSAYADLEGLTSVVIPDTVTKLEEYAFARCYNLTSVKISDSVLYIGKNAFYDDQALKTVDLGNSVQVIDSDAFEICSSLESIVIPDSVTFMGTGVFSYTPGLKKVVIGNGLPGIPAETFDQSNTDGTSKLEEVIIGESVAAIGQDAFEDCVSLKSIVIPENVEKLYEDAFNGCDNLTEVTLLNPDIEIDRRAFNRTMYQNRSLIKTVTLKGYNGSTAEEFPKICNSVDIYPTNYNYSKFVSIGDAPEKPAYYYIIGDMTDWEVDEDYKMTLNEETGEYEYIMELNGDSEFKVVCVKGKEKTWFPDGLDNNYGQNGEIKKTGKYTIRFRPDFDGGDNWFYGCILVVPEALPAKLGDANGDGEVDSVDATIVQRAATKIQVPYSEEQLMCADVDGDGSLTIVDASFIQRYDSKIAVPYPVGEAK